MHLLTNKMADDQESEVVVIEEKGENLVLCLGNLLYSASQKVAAETKETENKQTQVMKGFNGKKFGFP